MNHDNINKVIDWLNRGAPEAVFSMKYALRPIDDTWVGDPDDEDYQELAPSERAKIGNNSCGSVCCIAGAAAQFDGVSPTDPAYNAWSPIQDRALSYFGINPRDHERLPWMLPVFDPDLAPNNCSPQQAAEALARWAAHADKNITFNPWSYIE